MARLRGKLTAGNLFMIVIVAVMGVYLWGEFTKEVECTQAKVTAGDCKEEELGQMITVFKLPTQPDLSTSTVWIMKLLIIGGAVFLGYAVVTKLAGGTMNRRDVMTLILLGVTVYLLWDYVISHIMSATSIEDITFATVKKLGLG